MGSEGTGELSRTITLLFTTKKQYSQTRKQLYLTREGRTVISPLTTRRPGSSTQPEYARRISGRRVHIGTEERCNLRASPQLPVSQHTILLNSPSSPSEPVYIIGTLVGQASANT